MGNIAHLLGKNKVITWEPRPNISQKPKEVKPDIPNYLEIMKGSLYWLQLGAAK